jgi:hypothetical protein
MLSTITIRKAEPYEQRAKRIKTKELYTKTSQVHVKYLQR